MKIFLLTSWGFSLLILIILCARIAILEKHIDSLTKAVRKLVIKIPLENKNKIYLSYFEEKEKMNKELKRELRMMTKKELRDVLEESEYGEITEKTWVEFEKRLGEKEKYYQPEGCTNEQLFLSIIIKNLIDAHHEFMKGEIQEVLENILGEFRGDNK